MMHLPMAPLRFAAAGYHQRLAGISPAYHLESAMAKVTGIGGVFFKSRGDHEALAAWYQKHLGMPLEP